MVIGEQFAWGHLPKTGGDATLALFDLFPEAVVSADDRHTQDKHAFFPERAGVVDGKLLVLNIRRLPCWMLSWAHHQNRYGVLPESKPLPMKSPQQMAESSDADWFLSSFTGNGALKIGRWLRSEFLPGDFLRFMSTVTQVGPEIEAQVEQAGRVNELHYDHKISHWFREDQIKLMYQNNPIWTQVERALYPD